jgi:hypothetical protein
MPTPAHFQGREWHGQRDAHPPIAGAVHPEPFGAVKLNYIDRPSSGTLGVRVERHARPEPRIQHDADGVFLNMIDDASFRTDAPVPAQHIQDEARFFVLILQVRRVDKDELIKPGRQVPDG